MGTHRSPFYKFVYSSLDPMEKITNEHLIFIELQNFLVQVVMKMFNRQYLNIYITTCIRY